MKSTVVKLFVVWCALFGSTFGLAKSVYVIGDTDSSKILTYKVGDNELLLQKETNLSTWGAIDIAVNESAVGTFLFVTYEFESFIRVIDAKSMTLIDDVVLPHAADLSGIVYDSERDKVYTVDRFSHRFYSYSWDARNLSLEPDFDEPYYVELENLNPNGGAVGITFDWVNDFLYVSDATGVIKYYSVNGWSYEGCVETSLNAVLGVAINPQEQILYFGSMDNYGQQWKYLSSYDLTAPDPNDAQADETLGASICGITCDPETGYVYATSFSDGSNGHQDSVLMFSPYDPNNPLDPNLTLVWDSPRTGSPSGIVFSDEDYKPSGIGILKIDDVNDDPNYSTCVGPEDFVTYSIAVHSKNGEQTNVVVTDVFPYEADFVSADPNTGTYFPDDHVYIWDDITLPDPNEPGDPNVFLEITVQVNYGAEPSEQMVNKVTAESDTAYDTAEAYTDICCDWAGDVIYVDKDAVWERIAFYGMISATGYNSGTSWENAYRDLNDALERATNGCGSEIWVADGIYHPSNGSSQYPQNENFSIPENVSVYGGFCGTETSRDQRNWRRYKTVLSGYIDEYTNNYKVVALGDGSLLDGVTVEEGGSTAGIDASGGTSIVANSRIKDNTQEGIYCLNGNLTVSWCDIFDNGYQGIYHQGSGYSLTVNNSKIHENQLDGIRAASSASTILNSLIYQNGSGSSYYGINLVSPSTGTTLRNNTIVYNVNEGVRRSSGNAPDVRNNILFYNNSQETNNPQLDGISTTYYCCIYDPNSQSSTPDENGNITCEPDFVYDSEPYGYFHIKYESYCRNAGDNTYVGQDESDMDDETRIAENTVDIGADEVECTDTWHANDWNFDGAVNMEEFSVLSAAWLSHDPNDPVCDPNHPDYVNDPNALGYISETQKAHWNPVCDLDDTSGSAYAIDLADLIVFCEDSPQSWCWQACWRSNYMAMYSMSGGGEDMMMAAPLSDSLYSTQSLQIEPVQPVYEPTPEEEAANINQILDFLSTVLEEETVENEQGILEMKVVLEEWLAEIEL